MSLDVESKLHIYEIDDKDAPAIEGPELAVRSHWSQRAWVVLAVEGRTFTVNAEDLEAAIKNATNKGTR